MKLRMQKTLQLILLLNCILVTFSKAEYHTVQSSTDRPVALNKKLLDVRSYETRTGTVKVSLTKENANQLYDFLSYGTPNPLSVPIMRPGPIQKGGFNCLYEKDAKTYVCEFVVSELGEIRREQLEEELNSISLKQVSSGTASTKYDSVNSLLGLTIEGDTAEDIYNLIKYGKAKPESVSSKRPEKVQKGAIECDYAKAREVYRCQFVVNKHGISGIPVE